MGRGNVEVLSNMERATELSRQVAYDFRRLWEANTLHGSVWLLPVGEGCLGKVVSTDIEGLGNDGKDQQKQQPNLNHHHRETVINR